MSTADFIRAFDEGTAGLEAFSVGACPGCRECGLDADSLSLEGASIRGNALRSYDDGSGSLWVVVETLGPRGIVRADTVSDALECALDTILPDADPEDPDCYARSYDETAEEGELAEGVHYRPNGVPGGSLTSFLCAEDLNGCRLVEVPIGLGKEPPESIDVLGWAIDLDWGDVDGARAEADEGGFSWSDCDVCRSALGGNRYPAHYIAEGYVEHIQVCGDCRERSGGMGLR